MYAYAITSQTEKSIIAFHLRVKANMLAMAWKPFSVWPPSSLLLFPLLTLFLAHWPQTYQAWYSVTPLHVLFSLLEYSFPRHLYGFLPQFLEIFPETSMFRWELSGSSYINDNTIPDPIFTIPFLLYSPVYTSTLSNILYILLICLYPPLGYKFIRRGCLVLIPAESSVPENLAQNRCSINICQSI